MSWQALAIPGAFDRLPSVRRNWVDASPGSRFPSAAGRYHLYVSYACPWSQRCLITRALLGLEKALPVSVVHPVFARTAPGQDDHRGWHFGTNFDKATGDEVGGAKTVREIYEACAEASRFTVPFLWDCQTKVIVNNESSEIIRMLCVAFREFGSATPEGLDLYPENERAAIDEACTRIYKINNGVYRCGFATTQEAYDHAIGELELALDEAESHLSRHCFLAGGDDHKEHHLTLADIHLFPTLLRFDEVYLVIFKCNRRQIAESAPMMRFMRRLWSMPAFRDTSHMDHIKAHYYQSFMSINPTKIVPAGPHFIARLDKEDPETGS